MNNVMFKTPLVYRAYGVSNPMCFCGFLMFNSHIVLVCIVLEPLLHKGSDDG